MWESLDYGKEGMDGYEIAKSSKSKERYRARDEVLAEKLKDDGGWIDIIVITKSE